MKNKHDLMTRQFEQMLDFVQFKWTKGLDQGALHKIVWPVAKTDMTAHDSYLCLQYSNKFNRPWPTQRIAGPDFSEPNVLNFVGSNGGKITMQNHGACPVECRPQDHQDWLLC